MPTAQEICERLLQSSAARAVVLLSRGGSKLASCGTEWGTIDDGRLHTVDIGNGQRLLIAFDESTSLGLVRLRARGAVQELKARR